MALAVRVGVATDVGRVREHNEDAAFARGSIFVVADGMGGHAAGEVASAIAASTLGELAERAGGCGNEEAASGEDGDAESAKALLDVVGRRAGEEPGAGHRVEGGRLINEGSRQRIQPLDNPRS